jgi:hypothetical protein
MASTTLFAPQVRSVQPAFIYKRNIININNQGRVRIYYSLSAYNNNNAFSYVAFSIVDPNKASTWGSNSMINKNAVPSGVLAVKPKKDNNGNILNYIEIDLINRDLFNLFTTNQYYQVQLYLLDKNFPNTMVSVGEYYKVLESDLSGEYVSQPSQITLIRPISAIEKFVLEGADNTDTLSILTLGELKGFIQYEDKSTIEAIKSYYFEIEQDGIQVYKSDTFYNTLGTEFAANIYDCYLSEGNYVLKIYILTLNDFETVKDFNINIGLNQEFDNSRLFLSKDSVIRMDLASGAVFFELDIKSKFRVEYNNSSLVFQRSCEDDEFCLWKTIASFSNVDIVKTLRWSDYTVEGNKIYKYRILFMTDDVNYLIDKINNNDIVILTSLDDIYLSNKDLQLAVKFNPNISGLKYISQENVTNTLGGKYPIIRINGDTKYRQFNISGTLAFYYDWQSTLSQLHDCDSCGEKVGHWFVEQNRSLFMKPSMMATLVKEKFFDLLRTQPNAFDRKLRDCVIKFLNDRKPKLFRSATEGNMIVYLSGISFTPNKQLGRNIYDFSATATEICDFNDKNLAKYNLIFSESKTYSSVSYLIKVKEINIDGDEDSNGVLQLDSYVGTDNVIKYNKNGKEVYLPIVYANWDRKEE